jgi:phage I-like protein
MTEELNDTQTQPDAEGGGQSPDQGQRTFTQAELDTIIAERLKRQRAQFSDYDALKSQAAKWAEYEETQKTELQKAQDAAARAQAERDSAIKQAQERAIQSAFVAAAAKVGAAHPEDAYALADLTGVEIENGKVTGVTEAVQALVEAKRLVLSGRPVAPELDAGAGGGERKKEKALTAEQLETARKMGVSPEQYAKYLS